MAGTQTTVLLEGDPQIEESVAGSKVDTSEVVEYVGGSVGTVQPFSQGGTVDNLKVAKESLDVDYGGSYAASARVNYVVPKPGDKMMVKVFGTSDANGDVQPGDLLGGAAFADGGLAEVSVASDAKAVALGTAGTPASGTNKVIMEVEAI